MGVFDQLIRSNKEPKKGMKYIYLLDKVWKNNELGSYPIKFGSVVVDVIKLENDSFEFKDEETGEVWRTNYGWTLAEKTEENIENINKYLKSKKKLDDLKKETNKLRSDIIDLDGPSKI